MVFFGKPAPDLARQIETCLFISRGEGCGRAFYEFLPDSSMNLIFRYSASACRMVLLGPATKKFSAEIDEASDYFCIRFRPGQAPRLAELHPSNLIDTFAEIPKIHGRDVGSLADHLHSLPDLTSRQLLMEDLVRRSLPLVRDDRCRQASTLLEAHGGSLQVNQLADELGLHIRSLERLFIDHMGIPPKRLTRLIRLRRLLSYLGTGSFGSLADLAVVCGYTDQSHMIRDFKELTGRLPGETNSSDARRLEGAPRTRIVHHYRP